jgi:hypothetical protein
MGKVAECLAAWRRAVPGLDQEAAHALLATAVREGVRSRIAGIDAPALDREYLVEEVAERLLKLVIEGKAQLGSEDAFVKRAAFNATIDSLRRSRVERNAIAQAGREAPSTAAEDPESELIERETQRHTEELGARAVALIGEAPPAYGRTLRAVYLEGRDIGDLVQEEVRRRVQAGQARNPPDAGDIRKARATVDQWLTRSRAWLCSQLAQRGLRRLS